MKISKLKEKLFEFIVENKNEVVILINGEWGIGKTYFWQNIFLKEYQNEFKNKQIAYVSLFGYNSLNDMKTDIILQISKHTKYISKIQNKVKSLKGVLFKNDDINISLGGGVLSAGLSLLTTNDFKNIIICFDDFERLSSNIETKDLMGFISNLKEQKHCKIIMILNEEELKNIHKIQKSQNELETFSLYKEKIIDYEFLFENNINDFINDNIKINFDINIICNYFQKYNINNFRIIKQLSEQLNLFTYLNDDNITNLIKEKFIYLLFSILFLKKKYNFSSKSYYKLKRLKRNIQFKDITKSLSSNNNNDEENILTELQEEQINYIIDFENEEIEKLIWEFVENEKEIKGKLEKILIKLSQKNKINTDKDTMMNNWNKLHIDFTYKIDDFVKDIKPILEQDNIDEILGLNDYHFFVNFVKQYNDFDNEKIKETIKKYIERIIYQEKSISIHEEYQLTLIEENYPELLEYVLKQKYKILIKEITCKALKAILDKVKSGWGAKDEFILNNISKEQYKECILTNSDIVKLMINFLKNKKNSNSFQNAVKKNIEILQELERENKDFKFKVKEIFKIIGLK